MGFFESLFRYPKPNNTDLNIVTYEYILKVKIAQEIEGIILRSKC